MAGIDKLTLGASQAYTDEKIKEAGGMTGEGVEKIVKDTVGAEVNEYLLEDVESSALNKSFNLLSLEDDYTATKYGVTVSTSGQLITINGTWTATWNETITVATITLPAGNYRFSIWNIENLTDATLLGLQIMNGSSYTCAIQKLASETQSKFTLTEETELVIALKFLVGFTAENTTLNFMIATGLDATTQYEEYFEPYYESTKCIKEKYVKPLADKANAGINGNILYGKKWAVCGDSFSNGDFTNATDSDYVIENGLYSGKNKVYGYLIGNRNNMTIQHLAVGGRTIATPADGTFTNCFSYDGIYNSIDADTDYITLYFGINDSHHRIGAVGNDGEETKGIIELGTIDDADNTTFYGAWNVVLDYLIENYPNAHIGIIVSNGCETDDYRVATIKIAKKYGIPYIDLNGDERTPCMIRSTNTSISKKVRTARTKQWAVNYGTNNHPNAQAHEYQSKFIESFLRSL